MINAIELRLDNYLMVKKSNDAGYYRVQEIGGWIRRWDKKKKDGSFVDERLITIYGGARDGEVLPESVLRPIKLTTDILKKAGFDGDDSMNDYRLNDFRVAFHIHDGVVEWQGNRIYEFIPPLHQLQNLIFALTGEELNYNP